MVGIAKIRNATATDNESSDIEAAAFWAIAAQTEEGVKRCKHLLLTKPPLEWHFIDNRSTRFSPRYGPRAYAEANHRKPVSQQMC
jgi:hypothetical protein